MQRSRCLRCEINVYAFFSMSCTAAVCNEPTGCVCAGSNGVNVFMGLGVPWIIAAAYYMQVGGTYEVSKEGLSYALVLYVVVAVTGLLLMAGKRSQGGELGGSGFWRYGFAVVMASMWLLFVVLVSIDSTL